MKNILTILFFIAISTFNSLYAQHSVARQWNEKVLEAIRGDFARPTVHARNLFHTSAAMYDAWAVYDSIADTYFLGKTVHGYTTPFSSVPSQEDVKAAQEEAMSFAVYRIMRHRFEKAPRAELIFANLDSFMEEMGYDVTNTTEDYACGAAEMGNYIARHILQYGLQDGSNEQNQYANKFYKPINPGLLLELSGNINIEDLNRWQPLRFNQFIDQAGNPLGDTTPAFLSPEWGQVRPFSLQTDELTIYNRDGFDYWVYHDPGPPAHWTADGSGNSEEYKWNFALVSIWSSHLDPAEDVLWDISPASIGNMTVEDYPTTIEGLRDFYDLIEGGDKSTGYSVNPKTGQPYTPQIVQRGDYARVLAEFWADGPDSETPPGHWFTIINYVNDHPDLVKKMRGQGEILDDLEWDVKAYFALGGAMHDVAITSWGIKGWYDFIRPISAIRGMAELGQSSDPNLPSYNAGGLPLVPGYIELIEAGDPLQGFAGQYIGEVKLYAWKGPNFIDNPLSDVAGVGWIRAKNWFPYQRPTFVTPPFAGYVSGHSTYSRAAAEVLTTLTGDPFFPGGMGEFSCPQNEFLVFEDGPSTNLTLQWATYRDASDQCSLSRIWGGIHPPIDDIAGRLIGIEIGQEAFSFAESYFTGKEPSTVTADFHLFPNPTACAVQIEYDLAKVKTVEVYHIDGRLLQSVELTNSDNRVSLDLGDLLPGIYVVVAKDEAGNRLVEEKVVRL